MKRVITLHLGELSGAAQNGQVAAGLKAGGQNLLTGLDLEALGADARLSCSQQTRVSEHT